MTFMLLVCPNCRTRYVVPDNAIGADGRQVRCANCRHSWFQEGVDLSDVQKPEEAVPVAPPPRGETPVRRNESYTGDVPPPPPQFSTMAGASAGPDMPRAARRNPARYWTMAAIGFALLVVLLIVSNMAFGWLDESLPYASNEPPLQIIADPDPDRQTIENNGRESEYFAASGTIVNPTDQEQPVPPLLIVLYDAQGRKVFDWIAKPRVSTLPPGGSVEFNDAQLEVPRSAERMQIFWSE